MQRLEGYCISLTINSIEGTSSEGILWRRCLHIKYQEHTKHQEHTKQFLSSDSTICMGTKRMQRNLLDPLSLWVTEPPNKEKPSSNFQNTPVEVCSKVLSSGVRRARSSKPGISTCICTYQFRGPKRHLVWQDTFAGVGPFYKVLRYKACENVKHICLGQLNRHC